MLLYRVIPMFSPGMAGTETFKCHPATFEGSVFLYGFKPVGTTGGCKPAFGTKER